MRWALQISAVTLWTLWLCAPAALVRAQPQDGSGTTAAADEADRWQELVVSLGSQSFRERQRASDALAQGGVDAVPAVVGALSSEDAETRARAIAILERLPGLRNRSATRLARTLLEEQAAVGKGAAALRAQQALIKLRDGWTQYAIDQIQQAGGTVQHNSAAAGGGFQVQLAERWLGGSERLDLLFELEPIRWLSIEKSSIDDDGLKQIARLTELRKLFIGNSRVTGEGLAHLAPLKQLEYLSLKQLPIDDDALARLPELPQLTALGLDQTNVGDAGLAHVGKKLPQVEILWLDHTKVTGAGLKHLQPLKSLRILYLQGLNAEGDGLSQLAGLANLRYLSLKGATLQPDSLKQIGKLKQIETLGLDHTNVTNDQIADLVGLDNLRVLWLSKTKVSDAAVEHLNKLPDLTTVYLHGAGVTAEGAKAIRTKNPQSQVYR